MRAAHDAGRIVKVGFNHRFHPAISQLASEVHSGLYGELMHLRARYGHGGRIGYDREWRAKPARSGGGELIDQGMHLLDLTHWIAGPLPLHCALLRTHFWDTEVEDNAALILGTGDDRSDAVGDAACDLDGVEEHVFDRGVLPDRQAAGRRPGALVRDAEASDLPHASRSSVRRTWRSAPSPTRMCRGEASGSNLAGAIALGEPILGSLEDAHYAWSQGAGRIREFATLRGTGGRTGNVDRYGRLPSSVDVQTEIVYPAPSRR